MIKKYFDDQILLSRFIKRWKFGGNEPYEYINWKI